MRRAVIISANGPKDSPDKLRFAHEDAERMAQVFEGERCRFKASRPSKDPNAGKFKILEAINAEMLLCEPGDSFLVYYAGHGTIGRGGGLLLLLNSTDIKSPAYMEATGLHARE